MICSIFPMVGLKKDDLTVVDMGYAYALCVFTVFVSPIYGIKWFIWWFLQMVVGFALGFVKAATNPKEARRIISEEFEER